MAHSSKVSIILGSMFSGKSTELIRRTSRYTSIGISTVIINHSKDTRTGRSVKTHSGKTVNALKLTRVCIYIIFI